MNQRGKSIRILHVLADTIDGGAQRMVCSFVDGLAAGRFESAVVSLRRPRHAVIERELAGHGAPLFFLDKRDGFDVRVPFRLRQVFRAYKPDIIHTHRIALRYALLAGLGRQEVIVHTVHSAPETGDGPVGRTILRIAARNGVTLVAVGDEIGRSVARTCPRTGNVRVIPNGIALDRSSTRNVPSGAIRKQLGIPPDAFVVVNVARLNYPKNQKMLIEALAGLGDRVPPVHALIVGEGPHRSDLETLVARCGLTGRVHFLGQRDDVPALLHASDVFALTSEWEGNPLSVMEAMAAGLPVLATRVGSIPELVEEEVSGLLVSPGDVAGLSAGLSRLQQSPALLAGMGAHAALRARSRFGLDRMVSSYEELYLSLL